MSSPPAAAGQLLRARFGRGADGVWFAPGRANLMGEHTDYNAGFVLPFALGQGVTAAAARRPDRRLALTSAGEPGPPVEVALDELAPGRVTGWAAYPAGVAWALGQAGYDVPGAWLAFESDLPAGAGLSSSAALECATALALTELALTELALTELALTELAPTGPALAGPAIDRRELAVLASRAENEFAGVPSGLMDQSASLLARAGQALLLDCRTREGTLVPFGPEAAGARVLLIDTRARHQLAGGQYGRRRAECEQAARRLGVRFLSDLTDLGATSRLTDPVLRRRARHVVSDNQRVLQAAGLLRSVARGAAGPGPGLEAGLEAGAGDVFAEIGRLLSQAHESLRDDFEVSWPEADVTVAAARSAGALGARMIGGGFGGSVLALVPGRAVPAVESAVRGAFKERSWAQPGFRPAAASDGARRLGLQ